MSHLSYQLCMTLTYPNTSNVLTDHLVKKVSARLFLCKAFLSAFVISKYFLRRNFEPNVQMFIIFHELDK